jgi:hypothetical protein
VESLDGSGGLVVNLGRTVDDAVTARFAVLAVDPNRRPFVDLTQGGGHIGKDLSNIADDTTSGRYAGVQSGASGDGFQILSNPDFTGGSIAGYSVYDNNVTGRITLTGEADTTAPNSTGFRMKITETAGAVASPGSGGFFRSIPVDSGAFQVNTYHRGSTIIWRLRANIPVGYSVGFANNAFGTGGTFAWLTAVVGTGNWFEYVVKQVIGSAGSFGTIGFFYIDNGVNTGAVTWFVAMLSAVCTSLPAGIGIMDVDGNRRALVDFGSAHFSKHLGNVPDDAGSDRRAATANQKTGGDRGFTTIDGGNVIVAAGIDLSRGYTGKHLGNIPDDGTSGRRVHTVGILSARPAAGTAGRLYHATDVGANGTTYRDTGAAWVKVGVGHLGDADGNLDNVTNGTRCAWDTGTQKTAAVDSSGNLLLKNKTQASGSTFGPTTSSTSFSTMPEMSVTITTKGNNVLLLFSGSFIAHLGTGTFCVAILQVFRDGVALSVQFLQDIRIDGQTFTVSMSHLDAGASAGSHTYDVRWEVNNNSNSQFLSAQGTNRAFQVVELG